MNQLNFHQYIDKTEKQNTFQPTGIARDYYLDIIEICVDAYKMEELESRLPKDENDLVEDIQSYSRITCAIGVLISSGRKQDYLPLWIKMMDACCRSCHRITDDMRVDFAVKEILIAFKVMKDRVPKDKKNYWLQMLSKINPDNNYLYVIRKEDDKKSMHNINIYNMVGEYLRETEGLTVTDEYFDRHWPEQLERFDENGMYQDPGCPILYDLTTRCHIQIMLGYGYRGRYYEELNENLKKSGMFTLFMQSAAFELPYGGRSNQFLFNEALIASNCEYEANRYKKDGDLKTAGAFKRCAHLSVKAIRRWLEVSPPRHIKNFYPLDSLHGAEGYGYYDKYMVTLGSFIYIAYLYADDTIEEYPCPAEMGGYVFQPSKGFHKIFANYSGNSIEIDTKADLHYDSTGLGRYHKTGFPTELALSMPFTEHPNYNVLQELQKKSVSLCPGWQNGEGKIQFLCELSEGVESELTDICMKPEKVSFTVKYYGEAIKGCKGILEAYTLNQEGVRVEVKLISPIVEMMYYRIPLLETNGKDRSGIYYDERIAHVSLNEYIYKVIASDNISVETELIGNRNGAYRLATILSKESKLWLQLSMWKAGNVILANEKTDNIVIENCGGRLTC